MATPYTTKQGQTIDLACADFYGRTAEVTELVLGTNPGLADFGPVLPMGTNIMMPDVDLAPKAPQLVSLYD